MKKKYFFECPICGKVDTYYTSCFRCRVGGFSSAHEENWKFFFLDENDDEDVVYSAEEMRRMLKLRMFQ